MNDLAKLLESRFDPARCGDLDTVIALDCHGSRLVFGIRDQTLTVFPGTAPPADLTLYFTSPEQAHGILAGHASPIDAFMAGEFKSSGYLVWVFQTLAVFSKPIQPDT